MAERLTRARFQGSWIRVSLNSRLESNKEEEAYRAGGLLGLGEAHEAEALRHVRALLVLHHLRGRDGAIPELGVFGFSVGLEGEGLRERVCVLSVGGSVRVEVGSESESEGQGLI